MKCWQSVSDLHGAGAFDGVRSNLKVCPGRLRCGLAKRNVSRIALNNSRQRHGTATFPQGRRKRCLPSLQSSPAEGPASELQHQRKNVSEAPSNKPSSIPSLLTAVLLKALITLHEDFAARRDLSHLPARRQTLNGSSMSFSVGWALDLLQSIGSPWPFWQYHFR